jgi:asparagine synthase (glutamine-hydrolysing)
LHDRAATRLWQYWRLESRPHTDDLPTTIETVRTLLVDSINRQLIADVPVATLLSGGLDSSAITCIAAEEFRRQGRERLHTWSIDYRDNDRHFQASAFQPNADTPWAHRVAEFAGTQHHDVVIDTPELVDALSTAVLARDLPGMADVDASLYLFCQQIKPDYTVVLSGECADEIFGGYPWFHQEELLYGDSFPWVRMVAERAQLLAPDLRDRLRPHEYVAERYRQTIAEVPSLEGESAIETRRRAMFYLNMTWFMTTLLDRKDRMSMMASLEARVPFCDHRLVEYVWNIPWSMKSCDNREKGLLRRALDGLLPADVLLRKKSPYPKTHHPAYARAVRDWTLSILADSSSPLHRVVDAAAVRELAKGDHPASGLPWFGQLMSTPQLFAYLCQVDAWMRGYRVTIR